MFLKLYLLVFVLCVSTVFAHAQNKIRLQKTTYNFGDVELQDSLSHTFYFENKTRYAFRITRVKVDCSCTVSKYTQSSVAKGERGFITLTYLPYMRGKFDKKFDIYNQHNVLETTLTLKGNILKKEAHPAEEFLHTIGKLKSKTKFLHFGTINNQSLVTKKFDLYNPTDSAITFTGDIQSPPHIKVLFDAKKTHIIKPKDVGTIFITYDTKVKNDLGYLEDHIVMKTTKAHHPEVTIRVVASVEEYFPDVSKEELKEHPKLQFNYSFIDLGYKAPNDNLVAKFKVFNSGKSPLSIRKIDATQNCIVLTSPVAYKRIPPKESIDLEVSLNGMGKTGKQYGRITLFSNDPRNPVRVLQVVATLK